MSNFVQDENEVMNSNDNTKTNSADVSFEEALEELDKITNKLGSDGVPLNSAVTLYGKACDLLQHCKKVLEDAKNQVEKIQHHGGVVTGVDSLTELNRKNDVIKNSDH